MKVQEKILAFRHNTKALIILLINPVFINFPIATRDTIHHRTWFLYGKVQMKRANISGCYILRQRKKIPTVQASR